MRILDRLERRFGNSGIPNVTLVLILAQVSVYIISKPQPEILNAFHLLPGLVLQGQVWRLLSFLAVPPVTNPIFAFFFWYLFYLMGNSLEHYWGTFRYNVFLLVGYLATVAAAFLFPEAQASNGFLQGSVFLAFAFLNPDFVLYIFFILPVKIKWLALLTWLSYGYILITGAWNIKLLVLASICNFLLFFWTDIKDRVRTGRRHMASQSSKFANTKSEKQPFHRCVICGITDISHPDMDFRYCTECAGTPGYCADHLQGHEHIRSA
ncbi:hypothetical protein L0222_00215 [bacterium]|nr:hypothetical protein [bacterium]MCI0603318.1 hypothetical protein [bacterium]